MNLPILMYHRILPEKDKTDLTVTVKQFKQQMHYLKNKGFTSISLAELVDFINNKNFSVKKPVVITFDDAFLNIIEYAKPVLDEINYKAVVFVVVNAIDRYNFWDKGKNAGKLKCMSKGELKYLLMSGWEIGSHSLNHYDLTDINLKNLKKEIKTSKEKLENLLRTEIISFCYPYGKYNDEVIEEIKKSGYKCACAVESDNFYVTDNLFKLRRIFVKPGDSLFTFKSKISSLYLFYRSLKRR